MDPIYRLALRKWVTGQVIFVALNYLCAGTWNYWQGWLFLGVLTASTTCFLFYLAVYDKPLLERRLKVGPRHEQDWSQKIISTILYVLFYAAIVLPILDWRFGLSPVPDWVPFIGNAIIIGSFIGVFCVVRTNSWAAANVRVEADQKVIDSGPYRYVRHPMYAAATWLVVGIPLALGSWRSISLLVLFLPIMLWRLLSEEKILARDLPGYAEYMQKVRWRLIPFVW